MATEGFNATLAEDIKLLVPEVKKALSSSTSRFLESSTGSSRFQNLLTVAEAVNALLIKIRRRIHEYPELAYEEFQTSLLIQHILKEFDVKFTVGWGVNRAKNRNPHFFEHTSSPELSTTLDNGSYENEIFHEGPTTGTGIVAEIGTGESPCIGLRADFDALPIQEQGDHIFKSKREKKMHACGHDIHTTMLIGAAILLKHFETHLKGTVKLIFQPAEENDAGALMMSEEKVLHKPPKIQQIYAFHIIPGYPLGSIYTKKGPLMAAAAWFEITLHGKGGHGAFPYLCIDPMIAAVNLSSSLYSIPSRESAFSERDFALLSITNIKSSSPAPNVIPNDVTLAGTFRSLSLDKMKEIKKRINDITIGISEAFRCKYEILHSILIPPVENNPTTTEFYEEVLSVASANGKVNEFTPVMGAEDFAFFQQEVPGTFAFIGGGEDVEIDGNIIDARGSSLHSSKFAADERVLKRGASAHVLIAYEALIRLSKS